jgi:DNA polymerase-1
MSKIKLRDVQVSAWFADPDFRKHSLKDLEKHFLGYYRPDFLQVLKNSESTDAAKTYNIGLISPENVLFYAAQDALSTFELGEETDQYFKEFGVSADIDNSLLYPLMKMENHGIRINTLYLKEQVSYILPRLQEIEEDLRSSLSEDYKNINFNSPKQKAELLDSFGLDTGKKSEKTEQMSTGIKDIEAMIERMEAEGKASQIPKWLYNFAERSKLEKLQSTFFGSLLEQAELSKGRVRINYRNTQAATGRLSSGASFND